MKKHSLLHSVSRFLLLTVCVTIVSLCFLFLPISREDSAKTLYYRYFSGSASESSLAPDMLTADHFQQELPEVQQHRFYKKYEAERLDLPKGVTVRTKRSGYSGKGYAANLPQDTESALIFEIKIPQTQHYEITLCAAADQNGIFALRVNGEQLTQFSLEADDRFTRITFYGIFLEKGNSEIAIDTLEGTLDVDYLELSDDNSVNESDFRITPALCDPDASEEAERLYAFLCEQWEHSVLTGQYVSSPENRELETIYQMTGQLPAIRFGILGTANDRAQVDAAIDWNVYTQGIVGLMWQWNAPGSDSVYTDDTDFDLYSALRRKSPESVAMLSIEAAEHAVENGTLSEEALLLLRDIDAMAETLRPLANMDIPVLWRPLHEAGGGWYWWGGAGKNAYQQLWSMLYYRLTEYHRLHNLIWVWNGQSAAYLIPAEQYDIAAVDIYLQPKMEYGSRYEQFLSLHELTDGKKLLALSECSNLPDAEMMQLDNALWSWFGLWYGDYLDEACRSAGGENHSSNDLYNLYNSELTLSLNDFRSLYQ